jgi:hypothetical protein
MTVLSGCGSGGRCNGGIPAPCCYEGLPASDCLTDLSFSQDLAEGDLSVSGDPAKGDLAQPIDGGTID